MTNPQDNAEILLVEDEDIISMILQNALTKRGYRVTIAPDGLAAWEMLSAAPTRFETVLLDREMPRMDGITLLHKLKGDERLAGIPVIMETAAGDLESVKEGLAAGAYYYLTKPFQTDLLLSVVNAAVLQWREHLELQESVRQAERPFALLEQCRFRFRTPEDGRMLANFFARFCPEPEQTVIGLQELLLNAVEHGNLAISYAEKTGLMMNGTWMEEITARLTRPPYAARMVEAEFLRHGDEIRFTIRDEGAGFDWQRYLEFDPERAFDPHGRGIAMARQISFDRLEYQGCGNIVTATIRVPDPA